MSTNLPAVAGQRSPDLFKNKFESLDGAETSTKRKRIRPETRQPDAIHSSREVLTGIAIGRDLQENSPTFKTLMRAFEHGAVRTGPKIQINIEDAAKGKLATDWFNSTWMKQCDGRDDMHFAEFIALLCTAEKREGDALIVFDDFLNNDGTLLVFSADQLVEIEDWDAKGPPVWGPGSKCEKGVIFDKLGRVLGYAVTADVGAIKKKYDEVTTARAWHPTRNPNGSARLYKRPWRFNQRRGQADAWTISNIQRDIHEMGTAELQSAKAAAQVFAYIESDPGALPAIERAMMGAGMTAAQVESVLYGDGTQTGALAKNYKALEAACGGLLEYLNPGEKAVFNKNDRPSGNVSA